MELSLALSNVMSQFPSNWGPRHYLPLLGCNADGQYVRLRAKQASGVYATLIAKN